MFIILTLIIATLANAQVGPYSSFVYGQAGDFTTYLANNPSTSSGTLNWPGRAIVDSTGGVYISDSQNNRVLYYNAGSKNASVVYGQGGSFTSNTANLGGVSRNSLSGPYDLALDSRNNLFVSDWLNSRVLIFQPSTTTALGAFGQNDVMTTNGSNNGGITSGSLSYPLGIALDTLGNIYIADSGNNRVLKIPIVSRNATDVWGQAGSFTTGLANRGQPSPDATTLSNPTAVLVTAAGLFIADAGNGRVLYYAGFSKTATQVYGRFGLFTSSGNLAYSADTLFAPVGLALDSNNGLYIADGGSSRVLYYDAGSTTASTIYGQNGTFDKPPLAWPVSNFSFYSRIDPSLAGITLSGTSLYVANRGNNRVLIFPAANKSGTNFNGTSSLCFHEKTQIFHNGKTYSMQHFIQGLNRDCYVPHVVESSDAIKMTVLNSTTYLIATSNHLVFVKGRGLVALRNVNVGDYVIHRVHGPVIVESLEPVRETMMYFGLNCITSMVYANDIWASSFGDYHVIPSIWMNVLGKAIGIERASRSGDRIASFLKYIGFL